MNKFSTVFIIYLIVTNVVFLVRSNTLTNKKNNIHLNINKSRTNIKHKAASSSTSTKTSYTSTTSSGVFKKSRSKTKINDQKSQSYLKKNKSKQNNGEIDLEIWEKCANENQTCWFSGTRMIRYGAQGSYFYAEATNSFYCNNGQLGDPINGVYKACHIKKNSYTWKHCAGENQKCNFAGTVAVKYGADTRWTWRTAKNGVDCNNGTFGDPAWGTVKACYVAVDDYWALCSGEGGVCKFNGSSIVRYGANDTFVYREVTGQINCSYLIFGDPLYGTPKNCFVRLGGYSWVKCAHENQNCKLPGKSLVRYGEIDRYYIRSFENNVDCNNPVFGDPYPGVYKKCEYALYTVGGEAGDIDNLPEQDAGCQSTPNTSCGADAGFGFAGSCLSQLFGNTRNGVPTDTQTTLQFLWELNTIMGLNFDICLGDFKGETLQTSNRLSYQKCNNVPLMKNYQYGTIAGSVRGVQGCGVNPVDVSMCINFDRCGTVSLMVDAGLAQCAGTVSTGIGALLSPLSGMLDFIGIGISPKRRFSLEFDVAYRAGDDVATQQVTTYGHFYFKMGLALPLNNIRIAGRELKDLFSLNLDGMIMVDFGNSFDLFSSAKNLITNANKSTMLNLFNTINSGTQFELTMQVNGSFNINLNTLTRGFLPDISINLLTANVLFTNGNCGPSGLSKGVYFYLSRGFNNISQIVQLLVDQFKDLFSIFGVTITIPNITLNFSIGFFVTDDSIGVKLAGPGFSLFCIYIYNRGGSCGFNFSFFTAILEAAKWVIKHARQLFDDSGKVVIEMSNEVGRFSVNAANTVANWFRNDVRDFFERDVNNALSNATGVVGSFFQNDVGGVVNDTGKVLGNAANTVANTVSNVASSVGGWFRSW